MNLPKVFGQEIVLSPALVNRNLTWYKATTVDLGFDLDVLKGKLGFSFDLYQRDRTGLLAYRNGSLPNTFGATFASGKSKL